MLKPVAGLKKSAPPKSKPKSTRASPPAAAKAAPAPVPDEPAHRVSPLAPKSFAKLPPLSGVRLAAGEAGIKYQGRTDVLLAVMAPGTQVGGVFTTSKTASAPVEWCKSALSQKSARMLVVNSGNANAFTGKAGVEVVRQTADSAAALAGCKPQEVFVASTGVIGEPLPVQRITKLLPEIYENTGAGAWNDAARAIMTTDTFPKMATASAQIDGARVTINGIAKGSGMIAPDMATMLSFVFTDAKIPSDILQQLVSQGVQDSFNATTVDSDTSTSDTLLVFATGKGALHDPVLRANEKRLDDFRTKLFALLKDLAVQVVRDGEGAQHLVRINVNGAESQASAKKIALAIANSPLVKTAIAGGDANWGRIVMAVGKSGEAANRDKLSIRIGNHKVATNGVRDPNYSEAFLAKYMQRQEVDIDVDVGVGKFSSGVWTCDLTHGYIAINGDYRS
ncbi:MAG: bifunctional glutamate N-acetyltransferase/amino-acid acetyltransferase ArgJ [Alphaproteobacteria bacterium]|nr:bifunctional glutamate N-acetyltransferase/amino-acid acetyltransferase ArgJ [Alphaproteobacteria bacterium]